MKQKARVEPPSQDILAAFELTETPVFIPTGEGRVYKSGNVILKHAYKDNVDTLTWTANLFENLEQKGFRISKPIHPNSGGWFVQNWSAWTYVSGKAPAPSQYEEMIAPIQAFHRALKHIPKPNFIDGEDTPYRRADTYAWGKLPSIIHPVLHDDIHRLYALRTPIDHLTSQLIHGDLNPDNLLTLKGQPAAILDMAAYWRPANFSLAVYAYWIGPYKNKPKMLHHFSTIEAFPQLLLRAALRMLLIMSEFNDIHEPQTYHQATKIVEEFVSDNSTI